MSAGDLSEQFSTLPEETLIERRNDMANRAQEHEELATECARFAKVFDGALAIKRSNEEFQ